MKQAVLIVAASVSLVGASLFIYDAFLTDNGAVTLQDQTPQVIALGASVYKANCAACHGPDLEGEPNWQSRDAEGRLRAPPHDASGHTWHHDSELLFRLTKYGPAEVIGDPSYVSNMPAYQDVLSDDEIIAVLSYIKSIWPKRIRDRHDEMENR